ncbi:GDP-mannose mannosyl hydrolase [Endozoicomonadaceae bacterium StTr2]
MTMLEYKEFKRVVASTPLVSIDFLIENAEGKILLGLRNNRPAQGFWFVPGGRIRKDERLDDAFSRLLMSELGVEYAFERSRLRGPFEHFYSDNFSGTDFTTHYLAFGYEISLDIDLEQLPDSQHQNYQWYSKDELLASEQVHQHTKDYFK